MLPENPLFAPVPSKDQHETSPRTQEHSLGDVVESRSSLGPRLHLDRVVRFDATAPLRSTSGVLAHQRDDDEYQHHDLDDYDDGSKETADDCASFLHQDRDEGNHGAGTPDHERLAKRQLLELDRFERRVSRERTRRERRERRAERSAQSRVQRRRTPARRSRHLGRRLERSGHGDARLFRNDHPGDVTVRDRSEGAVSSDDRRDVLGEFPHMAADAGSLNRPFGARVHGTALVLYFLLLPYVVLTKWQHVAGVGDATLVRALLAVLAIFWLGFLCQVIRNVTQLRRGGRVKASGSAWLAGLVVAMLALLTPASHASLKEATPITIPFHEAHGAPAPNRSASFAGMGSLPLALMAKRRGDLLREQSDEAGDFDVDESIELLRARNPDLICHTRRTDRRTARWRAGRKGERAREHALDAIDAARCVRPRAEHDGHADRLCP